MLLDIRLRKLVGRIPQPRELRTAGHVYPGEMDELRLRERQEESVTALLSGSTRLHREESDLCRAEAYPGRSAVEL